jgi:hypothetical protein
MGIERYELLTVGSRDDLIEAYDLGVLSVDIELYCEACELPVGQDLGEFEPFAIIINERGEAWLACEMCHCDTTHPTDGLD